MIYLTHWNRLYRNVTLVHVSPFHGDPLSLVREACDQKKRDLRNRPVVEAALDAVPDRVNGLLIHRGRGGSSGTRRPRRPIPMAGSGAVALPEPEDEPTEWWDRADLVSLVPAPVPAGRLSA